MENVHAENVKVERTPTERHLAWHKQLKADMDRMEAIIRKVSERHNQTCRLLATYEKLNR
jgi:hypothetical protein